MGCTQCKTIATKRDRTPVRAAETKTYTDIKAFHYLEVDAASTHSNKSNKSPQIGANPDKLSGGVSTRKISTASKMSNVSNTFNRDHRESIQSLDKRYTDGALVSLQGKDRNRNLHLFSEIKDMPTLTDDERQRILRTWKVVRENVMNIGIIVFMNMFEDNPDVKEAFVNMRNLENEELVHSKELRGHALRVMGMVEKVTTRLEEPEKLNALLTKLGMNHVFYGAKIEFIDLLGSQFIISIIPILQDNDVPWTTEIESAWKKLFSLISFHMKNGMEQQLELEKEKGQKEKGQSPGGSKEGSPRS